MNQPSEHDLFEIYKEMSKRIAVQDPNVPASIRAAVWLVMPPSHHDFEDFSLEDDWY